MTHSPHRRRVALFSVACRRVLLPVLVALLGAGCDYPFQPIEEHEDAIFSMFGYLDLKADTQWVRVMPVRRNLLLEPQPIDAVVTLEEEASGHVITLRDSLFSFPNAQLGGVAHAYNFWTDERLKPGATYLLKAERSDGATTTATVEMPIDLRIAYLSGPGIGSDNALLRVSAEHLLFVDVLYTVSNFSGDPASSVTVRHAHGFSSPDAVTKVIGVSGPLLLRGGLIDVRRQEIELAVARADWPFHPGLPDLEAALPGTMPSNVENGFGYVGGVATWKIPFHGCQVLEARPDGEPYCVTLFDSRSASIEGRVITPPCGHPAVLRPVRLTERFVDGGAVARTWKTGWDQRFRFEGIEPEAVLTLDFGPGTPTMQLPPLNPGERRSLGDLTAPGC